MILDKSRVLIKTENLNNSYKYKNDFKEVLINISMRVIQGEFLIIKGIKGVEKKAFFNQMGCIERPASGKLYFDYEDIGLASNDILDSIRKYKIGYLFRNFNLISSMTVEENLNISLRGLNISGDEKNSKMEKVLKRFNITEIAKEKIYNISNFEKQIAALARAVINNPLMIIGDDPIANLNLKEGQKLIEYLCELNREGMTIMLIGEMEKRDYLEDYRQINFDNGKISEDTAVNIINPAKGAFI